MADPLSVRLPPDVDAALRDRAEKLGTSRSFVVLHALREQLGVHLVDAEPESDLDSRVEDHEGRIGALERLAQNAGAL